MMQDLVQQRPRLAAPGWLYHNAGEAAILRAAQMASPVLLICLGGKPDLSDARDIVERYWPRILATTQDPEPTAPVPVVLCEPPDPGWDDDGEW